MPYRDHPVTEYEQLIDVGTQLVDVRDPAEIADGTLPGAVNIPVDELIADPTLLDPANRVLVVCRSGARSARAASALDAAGFVDVVNLSGGMVAMLAADGRTR